MDEETASSSDACRLLKPCAEGTDAYDAVACNALNDCAATEINAMAEAANSWYEDMHVGLEIWDLNHEPKPIWISETGWYWLNSSYLDENGERVAVTSMPFPLDWSWNNPEWIADNFMDPWLLSLSGEGNSPVDSHYEAYAWYTTHVIFGAFSRDRSQYLLDIRGSDGRPTAIGERWSEFSVSSGQ